MISRLTAERRRRGLGAAIATLAVVGCSPSAPRPQVFVTNETSGDLTVLDGATLRVLATVPLGKRPRGIAASPDGRRLYVALSGWPASPPGVAEDKLPPPDRAADGIGVYDVQERTLVGVMRGVGDPEQLAVGADGLVYAASEDVGSVMVFDPETRSARATIPVGDQPEGLALSPNGRELYVTLEGADSVIVVDTAARRVAAKIAVGRRPRSIAFSPRGDLAYVTDELDAAVSVIDVARRAVVRTIALGGAGARPMGVAVSGDGARLFVTTGRGGEVVVASAADGVVAGRVKVGARPWGVCRSADGRRVFTANGPSNDVSAVDTATLKSIGVASAGQKPWGLACLDVR